MQMQVQHQFMTVMMVMVSGRNPPQMNVNSTNMPPPPLIPPINMNCTNRNNNEEKRDKDSYHTVERKTAEEWNYF
jgi:hypothetical protein